MTHKITFNLETPMSFIDEPTFDGLLAYCYAKEKLKGGFFQKLSYSDSEMIDFSGMPIAMHENGYFMASSMFYNHSKAIEFTERWRKRWANQHDKIADFNGKVRKVRINAETFKSYDMPIRCMDIERVCFFFQSVNVEEVERLLRKHLFAIGKKAAQGYGLITNFIIEESDFDFSSVFRPIPLTFLSKNIELKQKYCSYKPPYWTPENFAKCAIPDTNMEI